jgi:hypothetical protein
VSKIARIVRSVREIGAITYIREGKGVVCMLELSVRKHSIPVCKELPIFL